MVEQKEQLLSDNPCVFLPHYGEFGWLIMHHIRLINHFKSPYKTVCCPSDHRVYFPSANEFIDWVNPLPDADRQGIMRCFENDDRTKLIKLFRETRKEYDIIESNKFSIDLLSEIFKLNPISQIKEIPLVSICARNRNRRAWQNCNKWDKIIEYLLSKNYKVASIGKKDSSKFFYQIKINSWDYPDNESACVEILSKSKLYLGNNSGMSHLAAFCQTPMIVFDEIPRGRNFIRNMQATNKNYCKWFPGNNTEEIIKQIEKLL